MMALKTKNNKPQESNRILNLSIVNDKLLHTIQFLVKILVRVVRVVGVVRWFVCSGWSAWMICIQKMRGLHGLHHQVIEKS